MKETLFFFCTELEIRKAGEKCLHETRKTSEKFHKWDLRRYFYLVVVCEYHIGKENKNRNTEE